MLLNHFFLNRKTAYMSICTKSSTYSWRCKIVSWLVWFMQKYSTNYYFFNLSVTNIYLHLLQLHSHSSAVLELFRKCLFDALIAVCSTSRKKHIKDAVTLFRNILIFFIMVYLKLRDRSERYQLTFTFILLIIDEMRRK